VIGPLVVVRVEMTGSGYLPEGVWLAYQVTRCGDC